MPQYRIIVDLSDYQPHLLDGNIVVRTFPVAIGKMATQTPPGNYTIINKRTKSRGPFEPIG